MSKKSKMPTHVPKGYESAKGEGDTYAPIYESMLVNPKYQKLSYRQRALYSCMKSQPFGKRKPRDAEEYKNMPEVRGDEVFFFGIDDAIKYGLATADNHSNLYKDIKALTEAGFIDKLCDGKRGRWRAVYRLSDRWHTDST